MFCPCAVSGIPEGYPVFDVEFNATVAETSTSDAAFIVADLSKKLAYASRNLMQKTKADADLPVKSATEKLSLADKLWRAEAEVLTLKDENKQLKGRCFKLEVTAKDNEKVLESLRKTVEDDTNEKVALKGKITELEAVHSRVSELDRVYAEVAARIDGVYQEYKRLLLRLERSLCPCPSRPKVPKFSSSFWTG